MKTFKLNENLFYIDGFYYGVSDEEIKGKCYGLEFDLLWKNPKLFEWSSEISTSPESNCKNIIYTNNPSIPLPQLVFPDKEDEIEKLANKAFGIPLGDFIVNINQFGSVEQEKYKSWITGYKANLNCWSDEDMIRFGAFCIKQFALFQNRDSDFTKRLLPEYTQSKEKIVESFDIEMEEGEYRDYSTTYDQPDRIEYHKFDTPKPKLNSDNIITALNIKYK